MKRIITSLALAALSVATVSALDVSARVYMSGSLADGYHVDNGSEKGNPWNALTVNNQLQKDDDAIQLSMSSEKAGASFRIFYRYGGSSKVSDASNEGESNSPLGVRSAVLWFKPFQMLKISVGEVGQYLYTEQLDWWRDSTGVSYAQWRNWDGRYSNQTGLEEKGIQLELTPIEGLTWQIGAGAIGYNDDNPENAISFFSNTWDGEKTYYQWGSTVKYQINDEISAGIGYRDNGHTTYEVDSSDGQWKESRGRKIITTGIDFGNAWAKPYYMFLQPRFCIERDTQEAGEWTLDGICFDNYFMYRTGNWKFEARLPVTLRFTGEDYDPNYFDYEVKAAYDLNDTFTPYLKLASDHAWKAEIYPICLGSEKGYRIQDTFFVDVEAGTKMQFGAAEIYTALEFYTTPVYVDGAKYSDIWYGWAIPFSCSVKM